jgi:hypothetical protein
MDIKPGKRFKIRAVFIYGLLKGNFSRLVQYETLSTKKVLRIQVQTAITRVFRSILEKLITLVSEKSLI